MQFYTPQFLNNLVTVLVSDTVKHSSVQDFFSYLCDTFKNGV